MNQQQKPMEEIVEEEILEDLKRFKKEDRGWYFNNFYTILPGGLRRDDRYDKTSWRHSGDERSNNGPRLVGKTPAEFFEEVDATLLEVGLDIHVIRELEKEAREGDISTIDKIDAYAYPLYIRLREKGYTCHDLTG